MKEGKKEGEGDLTYSPSPARDEKDQSEKTEGMLERVDGEEAGGC